MVLEFNRIEFMKDESTMTFRHLEQERPWQTFRARKKEERIVWKEIKCNTFLSVISCIEPTTDLKH